MLVVGQQEFPLVGEVEVEGPLTDPCVLRYVADTEIVVADSEEQIDRGVDQPLTGVAALVTCSVGRIRQYLPYSLVKSTMALRFSGFT